MTLGSQVGKVEIVVIFDHFPGKVSNPGAWTHGVFTLFAEPIDRWPAGEDRRPDGTP